MKLAFPDFEGDALNATLNPYVVTASGALLAMSILVLGTVAMGPSAVKMPRVPQPTALVTESVTPVPVRLPEMTLAPTVAAVEEEIAPAVDSAEARIDVVRSEAVIELSSVGVEQSAFQFRLQRFIPEPALELKSAFQPLANRLAPGDLAATNFSHESSPAATLQNCNCLSSRPTYVIDIFEFSKGDPRPLYRDDPRPKPVKAKKASKKRASEEAQKAEAAPKKKIKLNLWKN